MKTLVAFLTGCLIAAPLSAVQQVANTFVLDDEDVQTCGDGGGCLLITHDALKRAKKALSACGVAT